MRYSFLLFALFFMPICGAGETMESSARRTYGGEWTDDFFGHTEGTGFVNPETAWREIDPDQVESCGQLPGEVGVVLDMQVGSDGIARPVEDAVDNYRRIIEPACEFGVMGDAFNRASLD